MFLHICKYIRFYSTTISLWFEFIESSLYLSYMSVEWTIYLKTTDDGSLAASETRLFSEGNSLPIRVLSALLNFLSLLVIMV